MRTRSSTTPADDATEDQTPAVQPGAEDAATAQAGTAGGPPPGDREPGSSDPLDHDGDGRKGGVAPAPEVTHLVVLESDAKRGLTAGEVIAVADADVKPLLADDTCRSATAAEVELAQPRIRMWMGLA